MSEKRYKIFKQPFISINEILVIVEDEDNLFNVEEVVDLLNELSEHNERLRKEIDNQAEIIRGQDSELYRLYKLCFQMSGILNEFGVYDVFDRKK